MSSNPLRDLRRSLVAKALKSEVEKRWITQTEIVERMKNLWIKTATHSIISNVLNWNQGFTDKYLKVVGEAIWMSQDSINNMLKSADIRAVKEMYWEYMSYHIYTTEELIDMICEKEHLDKDAKKTIKDFIKFQIQNKWNE